MSKVCVICKKGPTVGNNVSHSHNKTKRRWLPNLQKIKIHLNGVVKRIRVCTTCIKSGKVVKSI